MVSQDLLETGDLCGNAFISQPKKDDARMFELLPVDQLPEILVVCDEDSTFSPGNLEDFVILDRV